MAKKDSTSDSNDPITPKASQRVFDGEVLKGARQKDSSANAKSSFDKTANAKPMEAKKDWSAWLPTTFMQKIVLAMTVVFILLIVYTVQQANNNDWQVERINQLQQELVNLKAQAQALETEQQQQKEQVAQALQAPENQPAISQADVDAVKQQMDDFKSSVETTLNDYAEKAKTWGEQAQAQTEKAVDALEPSEADKQALKEKSQALQAEIETQLQQMGRQLSELFNFKQEQQQRNELMQQKDSELAMQQEMQQEQQATNPTPLTSLQVQQWMVEINTQWMLTGNVAQTKQQLMALEQAIGVSDLPKKMSLVRRIGEDLNQLDSQTKIEQGNYSDSVTKLRTFIQALPQPEANPSVPRETNTASTQPQADTEAMSGWDKLVAKFSELFTVRKRESTQELTQVETLMMHDVLVQRGLLLADRVQWALDSQSAEMLSSTLDQLNEFAVRYFPAQAEQMVEQLAPLRKVQFEVRKPLNIIQAW